MALRVGILGKKVRGRYSRRYCGGRWWPSGHDLRMFDPARVRTTRYPYRGVLGIRSPWATTG